MADRRYEFEIGANDEAYRRAMERVATEAQQAGRQVGEAFKRAESEVRDSEAVFSRIKTTLAGAFTVGAVVQFGRAIASSVIEAERSTALLNNTLRATGFAAGLSGQQVEALVQELAGLSVFDDDPIRQGVTSLLRFREISGDTFREASRLAVDLAAATGKDLPAAFTAVGKALQDPATGMKGLREVGVKLSEGQADLAKKLKETGDEVGAQKIVLDELAKTIGGSAQGETAGLYGATRSLANAWDDLLKTIGQLPAVAESSKSSLSGLTAIINLTKRALEPGGAPGLSGSIGASGVIPGKPTIGKLSEAETLALQQAKGARVKIAEPKPIDPEAAKRAAAAFKARQDADYQAALAFGKATSDQEIRQIEALADAKQRLQDDRNTELVKLLQEGPELAAKQQKEFEDLATKLLADTRTGREQAILGVGGELDSLNERLIRGKVNVEQYEEAYALLQTRLNEVRGVQKDFAKELSTDQIDALRAIEQAVQGWGRQFTETIVQMAKKGKFEFGQFVDALLTDIARLAVQQTISAPIFKAIGGALQGGFSNLFGSSTPVPAGATAGSSYSGGTPFTMGTPRAGGGSVSPGMIYPINERGIEYFAPSVPGKVIPADGFSAGGAAVNLNITANVAAGATAADVRAAILESAALAESNIARRLRRGE